MFGSLLVINYLWVINSNIFSMVFVQREKYSNIRAFSVFTQTHKNKSIVNLYQKELLGCFSEDIKTWPSHNVLNWWTSNWLLCNIYVHVDSMGLYTNVNSLIFWVHYSSKKISENETALNCGFGLQLQTQLKLWFKAVSLIKLCVIM